MDVYGIIFLSISQDKKHASPRWAFSSHPIPYPYQCNPLFLCNKMDVSGESISYCLCYWTNYHSYYITVCILYIETIIIKEIRGRQFVKINFKRTKSEQKTKFESIFEQYSFKPDTVCSVCVFVFQTI